MPATVSSPPHTPPTDRDEYEPADAGEFDRCPACSRGLDHWVEEHVRLADEATTAQGQRDEALYRHAALVYETDRL